MSSRCSATRAAGFINDDAKTFFSTYNKKYDLIVSEPSNPWVSGVAGLFSAEFYRLIGRHMNDDALFVQWLQLYEINVDLVVSVLKAISANFSDYAVYASNNTDIMVIARKNGQLPAPDAGVLKIPAIADALKMIHVEGVQDIEIRRIGNKRIFSRLLETFPIQGNSDYYPVLDQDAARARFLGSTAQELLSLHYAMTMLVRRRSAEGNNEYHPFPGLRNFTADLLGHGPARLLSPWQFRRALCAG